MSARPVLITGGAGFIGTNLAHHLLDQGVPVMVLDNLSRPGAERNLRWLRETHGRLLEVEIADIRDPHRVRGAVLRAAQVFHFAAQVAVTTSIEAPSLDFEINLRGTLNLLEALRAAPDRPPLVYTSTNKVYGNLTDVPVKRDGDRYTPSEAAIAGHGVNERRPLDFHSPYGCSKGAADQYVQDYTRTFGLRAAVVRMSCIYGPHQFGNEDQGWVAHFLIRALQDRPISVYGDGLQVRDVLYVSDLLRALCAIGERIDDLRGQAFNVGGGPANATSLLELLRLIEEIHGRRPQIRFAPWRTGDQKYYVSDTRRLQDACGWSPQVSVRDGVAATYRWLQGEKGRTLGRRGGTAVAQAGCAP